MRFCSSMRLAFLRSDISSGVSIRCSRRVRSGVSIESFDAFALSLLPVLVVADAANEIEDGEASRIARVDSALMCVDI